MNNSAVLVEETDGEKSGRVRSCAEKIAVPDAQKCVVLSHLNTDTNKDKAEEWMFRYRQ